MSRFVESSVFMAASAGDSTKKWLSLTTKLYEVPVESLYKRLNDGIINFGR